MTEHEANADVDGRRPAALLPKAARLTALRVKRLPWWLALLVAIPLLAVLLAAALVVLFSMGMSGTGPIQLVVLTTIAVPLACLAARGVYCSLRWRTVTIPPADAPPADMT